MFRLIAFCLGFLVALPAIAAAQIEPLPNPIQVPGAPWYFDSFIVDAPREEGWASFSKDAKSAELGKKYDDGHTAAAIVEAHKLQEPVTSQDDSARHREADERRQPEPGTRLADYTTQIITPKGLLCARSAARFEDAASSSSSRHLAGARPDLRATGPPRDRGGAAFRRAHAGGRAAPGRGRRRRAFPAQPALHADQLRPHQPGTLRGGQEERRGSGASAAAGRRGRRRRGRAVPRQHPPVRLRASPRTLQGARKWLEIAAGQGRIDAIYNLGAIYDKGIGVPRNPGEAIKWFTLAADQRDPTSQLNLALFYLKGDGVDKSLPTAELWLKRSANNGGKRAQGILASGAYKKQ